MKMATVVNNYITNPQPGPGNQVVNFTPGLAVNKGDIINSSAITGAHVVLRYHVLGQTPYLPGQSNDFVHWSCGPQ
jgi:hypothetical protein